MKVNFNKITFYNIQSYGASKNIFYFTSGLHLITGDNGVGKSTIQDALCFCLYGKPYRDIKIKNLINRKNKKNLYTEVEFSINSNTYNIIRTLKPDTLKIIKNGVDLSTLSSKSLNQQEIDKIIGLDYDLFKQVISLSVNTNKPFISLPAAKKREIVEQIFDVMVFSKMFEIHKEMMKDLKKQIEFGTYNAELLSNTLDTLKAKYIEIDNAKKLFKTNKILKINNLEEEIKVKNKEIEHNNIKLNEITTRLLTMNNFNNESLRKELDIIKSQKFENESAIKDIQNKIRNIELDKFNIPVEVNELKSKLTLLENNNITLSNLIGQLNKSRKFIVSNNKPFEKNEDFEVLLEKNNQLSKAISNGEYGKSLINKKILKFDGLLICPECNTEVTEAHRDNEIKKYNDEISQLDSSINENQSLIQINKDMIQNIVNKEIDKIDKEIKVNEDKKNKNENDISEIKSNVENIIENYKKEELKKLNELLQSLNIEKMTINEKIIIVENNFKIYDENEKRYQELNNDISKIEVTNENFRNDIRRIENELVVLHKSKFEINTTDMKQELKDKYAQLTQIKINNKANEETLEIYNTCSDLLSDTGIKSYFFKNFMPLLNDKINEYLKLFEMPITVIFNEFMEENIFAFENLTTPIEYMSYSEGEKKRIDLSILLSFISVTKTMSNWDCNLLIIDELLDGAIDDKGLEKLALSLKNMTNNENKIYVISHRLKHDFIGLFNNKIQIERKKNGFSMIKINGA